MKSEYTKLFEQEFERYIALGFNQDEVTGFMDGFLKGYEVYQSRVNVIMDKEIRTASEGILPSQFPTKNVLLLRELKEGLLKQ